MVFDQFFLALIVAILCLVPSVSHRVAPQPSFALTSLALQGGS